MKLIAKKPLKFSGANVKSVARSEIMPYLKQSLNELKRENQNDYFKYKRNWRKYTHRLVNEQVKKKAEQVISRPIFL